MLPPKNLTRLTVRAIEVPFAFISVFEALTSPRVTQTITITGVLALVAERGWATGA